MKLSLNDRDRNPIWFIPKTNIAFTYENPGPIEIDLNKLTELQKKQIQAAVSRGVLSLEGDLSLLSTSVVKKEPGTARSYSSIQEKAVSADPQIARMERLKELLEKGVHAIREDLKEHSVSDLRLLLGLEESTKNRKSVKEYISQHISRHQREVMETVSRESAAPTQLPDINRGSGLTPEQLMNISDVVEEEIEEITFQFGADKNA